MRSIGIPREGNEASRLAWFWQGLPSLLLPESLAVPETQVEVARQCDTLGQKLTASVVDDGQ